MDLLTQIPGIGTKTLEKLKRLKISTPKDLLYHFPSRYVDFSHSINIENAKENENITITGKVTYFQNIFTRHGKNIQKANVQDKTGSMDLVWFNQPYLSNSIKIGENMSFAGTVTLFQRKKTIIAPEYGQYNTGKIIAIYPETSGLSSKWFRKTIQTNLVKLTENTKEHLPTNLVKKNQLIDLKSALVQVHLPKDEKSLNSARTRLAVDEVLSLQTQSYLNLSNTFEKVR